MPIPDELDQQEILDRIIALEEQIATNGNATRDAMIEQGDLLNKAAPGGGKALEAIAARCGLTVSNARVRKSVAAKVDPSTEMGREVRRLLTEHDEVYVSFDALNSVLNDADPLALLTKLLADARTAGGDRITRDAVRKGRGITGGSVGTADATGEKLAKDPAFAAKAVEAMGQAAKDMTPAQREALVQSLVSAGLGITEPDREESRKARERSAKERDASESETPTGIRALKVLPLMLEVDAMLEKFETAPRDEESLRVMELFAGWAERMSVRARSLSNGDFLPPSDDEFTRGLEAILDGAS